MILKRVIINRRLKIRNTELIKVILSGIVILK